MLRDSGVPTESGNGNKRRTGHTAPRTRVGAPSYCYLTVRYTIDVTSSAVSDRGSQGNPVRHPRGISFLTSESVCIVRPNRCSDVGKTIFRPNLDKRSNQRSGFHLSGNPTYRELIAWAHDKSRVADSTPGIALAIRNRSEWLCTQEPGESIAYRDP
jgi:hypothetical protein